MIVGEVVRSREEAVASGGALGFSGSFCVAAKELLGDPTLEFFYLVVL